MTVYMYALEFKSFVVDKNEYLMNFFSSNNVVGSLKKLMHNYILTTIFNK